MLIGVSGDRNRRVLPTGVKAWRMDGHEITQNAEGEERPDSRVLCFSCPVRDYVASARAALAITGESVE